MFGNVTSGQPITAALFNRLLDAVKGCMITSVVGGRVARNANGGTTLTIDTPRGRAGAKGDADVGGESESAPKPETLSVETKNRRGRVFSLFGFKKPSAFELPSSDRDKVFILARDGREPPPRLVYVMLEDLVGAALPAGVYDKDTLLWNDSKKNWEPKKTMVVNAVVNVEKYGAAVRMRRQKVRVIVEDENPGAWETIFTGENCTGIYG